LCAAKATLFATNSVVQVQPSKQSKAVKWFQYNIDNKQTKRHMMPNALGQLFDLQRWNTGQI